MKATLKIRRLFLAIVAISFFWTIGAMLFIQFPALVKNALTSDKAVASVFLAIFSIGVAIGSVAVNRLLKGEVSARYSTAAVLIMGLFVLAFWWLSETWQHAPEGTLYSVSDFIHHPAAVWLGLALLFIAIFGGIFVVPLYAFLTTTVREEPGGAHRRRQQHRQCRLDGDRHFADDGTDRARRQRRGPVAARGGDVHRLGLARLDAAQGVRASTGERNGGRPAADGLNSAQQGAEEDQAAEPGGDEQLEIRKPFGRLPFGERLGLADRHDDGRGPRAGTAGDEGREAAHDRH